MTLTGAELDTLYALALRGKLEIGDVPSKVGVSDLCERKFAYRDENHDVCITATGLAYFKEYKWAKGTGQEILDNRNFTVSTEAVS